MTEISNHLNENPLESWKEIAAYLKRDVRTVKRWEKSEGLPVHRQMHHARGNVFAYPSELEAWKSSRELRLIAAPPFTPWRRAVSGAAFALAMLLALVTVSGRPIHSPTGAAAQQFKGIVNRQVWAGPEVDILGSVSSDGRYLSYTDWETGDLAVRDLETGKNRHLTDKGSWFDSSEYAESSAVSPDGKQVAYAWFNQDYSYELRLIGLDGSKPRVLYNNRDLDWIQPAGWSPDGKHILATFMSKDHTNQIVLVSALDGSVRLLKALDAQIPMSIVFSPDGRYVAYDLPPNESSPNRNIFLLSTDGKHESTLIEHPANDFCPVWTPDGKHILFASDRTGSMGLWAIGVAEGKPQGAAALVKQDVGRRIRPLGFTREGSLYYGLQLGMVDIYIASLDFETGKLLAPPKKVTERFVGSNRMPDWSPDGRYLAYVSFRGIAPMGPGAFALGIQSIETGEERDLSPKLNNFFCPRWSADGRSILLVGADLKNRRGVYQMDVRSGDVTTLVQGRWGEYIGNPAWSPDGKAIFYVRQDYTTKKSRLVVREFGTGQEKEIYRSFGAYSVFHPDISPDGQWVAFASFEETTGAGAVIVVPSTGGVPREIVRQEKGKEVDWPVWTRDGSHVLFTKAGTSLQDQTVELWSVPGEGGKAQKLNLAMEGLRDVRVHPDGQRIAFPAGELARSEVWVMENFLPAAGSAK